MCGCFQSHLIHYLWQLYAKWKQNIFTESRNMKCGGRREWKGFWHPRWSLGQRWLSALGHKGQQCLLQWTKINSESSEVLTISSLPQMPRPLAILWGPLCWGIVPFSRACLLSAGYSHNGRLFRFSSSLSTGMSRLESSQYSWQYLFILLQKILFQITFIEHLFCVGYFHKTIPVLINVLGPLLNIIPMLS